MQTNELGIYLPEDEESAKRNLALELGLDLTEAQIKTLTVKQILGLSSNPSETFFDPIVPLGDARFWKNQVDDNEPNRVH